MRLPIKRESHQVRRIEPYITVWLEPLLHC